MTLILKALHQIITPKISAKGARKYPSKFKMIPTPFQISGTIRKLSLKISRQFRIKMTQISRLKVKVTQRIKLLTWDNKSQNPKTTQTRTLLVTSLSRRRTTLLKIKTRHLEMAKPMDVDRHTNNLSKNLTTSG